MDALRAQRALEGREEVHRPLVKEEGKALKEGIGCDRVHMMAGAEGTFSMLFSQGAAVWHPCHR